MTKVVDNQGLIFKKLDLHVHTPISTCFPETVSPEDIVEAAINNDLHGIAITDHNSAEWVDKVIEAAEGKPLVVFPGVEITCTGGRKSIHIIGIFDILENSKHIEGVLNVLGIRPNDYGKQDALTNKSPIEVINIIHDWNGIAVLAHANSSNGVLADMSGEPRTRVIQHPRLLAVESTDYFNIEMKKKNKRVVDLLDGTDPTYQRKLAVYQASDNPCGDGSGQHCLEGIANRYSYFKLEQINLEGLRQCFIDPDVRIFQEGELPERNYPRIKRVKIDSGFLDGQELKFHDGLTTILGAKGAGKSLLIEFLRFAFNQEPRNKAIKDDHIAKLGNRLGEYGSVEVVFIDENGKETNFKRVLRELDGSPYDDSVPYDPAQVFPVLFLSQNEIIKIAEAETEQLDFIDQFFDFRSYRARITSLEGNLERLDKKMSEGLRAYAEYDELTSRINTLEEEVLKLDEALKNPIFEMFKRLETKKKLLEEQRNHLTSFVESVETARDKILDSAKPKIPETFQEDPALRRNSDLIQQVHDAIAEQLSELLSIISVERNKAEQEYKEWYSSYMDGKKEYEEHIQMMGGDYKAIALSREKYKRDLDELKKRQETTKQKKDSVQEISKSRNEYLDEIQDEYRRYTEERSKKCKKFQENSAGKLQLQILGSSNVDEFRSSLLSLKRGSYLRDDEIEQITSKINPRDFVLSLLRYDATKETRFLEEPSKEANIELHRMKILADFLLSAVPYEDLLQLQYNALPQDRPEILYNIGDDDFQPLASVSVGQKCTSMLLMALSDGTMPIVIDQPEDSLDIRSIWEDMCTKLRYGKERRQFIFTTHNSSLAVASDTDCYLVMEGDASRGKVVHVGSMDNKPVSSEVLKYLEGGIETYKLKYAKYGGEYNM